MKLALFTAAINCDNSGDSIIESAITRLIKDATLERVPLGDSLAVDHIATVNTCDAALICGTNLYQNCFACALTEDIVRSIKVPIIPFGIGSSAPIGEIPRMNAAGVAAVRAIHETCRVSSVRDGASLRFLHSIGVRNTMLTGCPVFFHGLSCPNFSSLGEGYTLAPRARLLHIDHKWEARQNETLDLLANRYRPRLVLQSPYDFSIAEPLAKKYGLEIVSDPNWQAEPYITAAKQQRMSLGFRLHFAMLSLSYGKMTHLVSHDSRAWEFCKLVGLPLLRIEKYTDVKLVQRIDENIFDWEIVQHRWCQLSVEMNGFMGANGLATNLAVQPPSMHAISFWWDRLKHHVVPRHL
jgi:polysaccharide pyruvyl transferase WcaK-like protein